MTASQANHERVLALLLTEETEQYVQETLAKESPAAKRGKPSMSEITPLSIFDQRDRIQLNDL
jgi:hypothetical protein